MLKLRLRNQSQSSGLHEVWLVEPRLVIGTAKECQLVLSDDGLKKQHAVVDISGESLRLRAMGPLIEINGRPINEGDMCELNTGDKLSIASVVMDVVDPKLERRDVKPVNVGAQAAKSNKQEWALKANHSALSDRVYTLSEQTVVGRSSECDIVLAAAHLSRQHARLFIDQGALYVRDLGSSNGTFLNGVRVEEARVRRGDELAFDSLSFGVLGPAETVDKTLLRAPVNPTVARPVRAKAAAAEDAGSATTPDLQRARPQLDKAPEHDKASEAKKGGSAGTVLAITAVLVLAVVVIAKFTNII
ncbi:FHA domain-containing protein [Pseudoteredinibacter isoporae]|uniref:PSer/pThr/pTyr-binding forkhead associated (FHA) protein n=1 Tax=Pseudoteredinibacter isoporae TaxID=570281 RepID=A0A7X0MY30_9GAMM|nr:FHA domain-containing protein [Pseudoteredinibacter isoporae]MBB6521582.1 pSer/pThr/pTyr-binding forkhead associated (FHA) protein [Pseudoteredinibacter isoporae]NHO87136.1 FHA domain-containing protein [Pseudoteredinibacter isoporae]NIB22960.1 FHA domain-containing protein [Pseudoteredinibacter isoporae]